MCSLKAFYLTRSHKRSSRDCQNNVVAKMQTWWQIRKALAGMEIHAMLRPAMLTLHQCFMFDITATCSALIYISYVAAAQIYYVVNPSICERAIKAFFCSPLHHFAWRALSDQCWNWVGTHWNIAPALRLYFDFLLHIGTSQKLLVLYSSLSISGSLCDS